MVMVFDPALSATGSDAMPLTVTIPFTVITAPKVPDVGVTVIDAVELFSDEV